MARERRKIKRKVLEKAYLYIKRRALTERRLWAARDAGFWWHYADTTEKAAEILHKGGLPRVELLVCVNALEFCNEEGMTKQEMCLNLSEMYEII